MRAIWNDTVIAEAPREELVYIEGSWYFPPGKTKHEFLHESITPSTSIWIGVSTHYTVGEGESAIQDGAWTYKEPKSSAVDIVKHDFAKYFAFGEGITVTE